MKVEAFSDAVEVSWGEEKGFPAALVTTSDERNWINDCDKFIDGESTERKFWFIDAYDYRITEDGFRLVAETKKDARLLSGPVAVVSDRDGERSYFTFLFVGI